ncbi:MAG: phenylalanine--tRNA ligase subunit alpha [Bacteroidales bacterium]|nr:phenylalanine--tRNA ligase subunit alpha [Bacteroidales bacterium]
MIDKIQKIKDEIEHKIINNNEELENFRLNYLSKRGIISQLFDEFRKLDPEYKKNLGKPLNDLKNLAEQIFKEKQEKLSERNKNERFEIDFTLPSYNEIIGNRHPISIIRKEICDIFEHLGFTIEQGPEIEDDWHVFSALNFPPEHPARDMQDTFFIEKMPDILLRTHTSSVQIRAMEKTPPPLKIIMPGRVFRNEAISARAHCIFHQIEGLYIDTDVSFADLKQVLLYFAREFFGKNSDIRLRPSFFPFTEPSAEMDVSCSICNGKGCNVCKYTGWLEILGCGMVHPNVLKNTNINPEQYSGYAFGMGIERITMLRYAIRDLRLFFENDIRFLEQF